MCDNCWSAAVPPSPLGCDVIPPAISLATAVGLYDGPLRDIIQALKYDPRPTIAKHLAWRMRAAGVEVLSGADLVVPVPLHRSRERTRGFNQARALALHLGLPVCDALVRVRRTEAQADLPAERRHANVRGAFAIMPGLETAAPGLKTRPTCVLTDRVVVLVDDVWTTGATLSACAAVLRDAGAAEVRALTAARAPLK